MPHWIAKQCLLFVLSGICSSGAPTQPHPANPHYFLFQGKPAILITSAEHYGVVINMAFDYVPCLDALTADALNSIVNGLPASDGDARGMSEPGRTLYIYHSSKRRGSYVVTPGSYRERLVLKLPPANYNAEWIEPESGSVTASENFMLGSEKQGADFSRLLHRCGLKIQRT